MQAPLQRISRLVVQERAVPGFALENELPGEDDRLLFWPGPNGGPDKALKKFLRNAADEKTR